jgi:hypothetical protein
MNYAQVELLAKEIDEIAILDSDPHIKAKLTQIAAMLRVLLHRYERVVKNRTTFDERVERMLI